MSPTIHSSLEVTCVRACAGKDVDKKNNLLGMKRPVRVQLVIPEVSHDHYDDDESSSSRPRRIKR